MKDRKAAIRLYGQTDEQEPIQVGVPQGSLAAPILFMLFTASLFKLFFYGNKKPWLAIRGYVDDGLITASAKTEKDSILKTQAVFLEVEKWAYKSGIVFDPETFEAVHFSRKRQFANPEIQLPPPSFQTDVLEPRVVKPVGKNRSMRWLGVYFDPRLSFSDHAEKMASKGRRAAEGLIMLANIVQGVDAKTMQCVVHAYILPILPYSVSAWWPGRTRTNKNGKTIWNRVDGHLKKLDKAQNVALRAILPV